ncbi:MAG: response regulator [Candidatus Nanopelagicales bacterium]
MAGDRHEDRGSETRVVVIEDEPLTRGLLVSLLQGAGFVVESAGDAPSGVALIRDFEPAVILVDLGLGAGPGGIEVLTWAQHAAPGIAQIVLTNYPTAEVAGLAEGAIPPAASFLHKREMVNGESLVQAVRWALAGMPAIRHDHQAQTSPAQLLALLSPDQLQVLRMVAQGLSNAEIAIRRGTTPHAVETLFQRTLHTLGVTRDPGSNSRVMAARLFYELGGPPT